MMTWILASETCLMRAARLKWSSGVSAVCRWVEAAPREVRRSRISHVRLHQFMTHPQIHTSRPLAGRSPPRHSSLSPTLPPLVARAHNLESSYLRLDRQVLDLAVRVIHERKDLLDGRVFRALIHPKLVARAFDVRDEIGEGHEPAGETSASFHKAGEGKGRGRHLRSASGFFIYAGCKRRVSLGGTGRARGKAVAHLLA